jgi:presenilin-like A22 family membrane protease
MVACAMADDRDPNVRIEHPNRRKGSSQIMRTIVVILLLVSAGLMLIVTVGGWSTLEGARPVQIAYLLVYLLLAFFVARWSRGVLPLIAALAIVLMIFALVSVPGWFDRDQAGFIDPGLPSSVLGLVTALIIPVQVLLIATSLSGFRQQWNIEIERRPDDDGDDRPQRRRPARPDRTERGERGGGEHSAAPA